MLKVLKPWYFLYYVCWASLKEYHLFIICRQIGGRRAGGNILYVGRFGRKGLVLAYCLFWKSRSGILACFLRFWEDAGGTENKKGKISVCRKISAGIRRFAYDHMSNKQAMTHSSPSSWCSMVYLRIYSSRSSSGQIEKIGRSSYISQFLWKRANRWDIPSNSQ